MNDSPNDDDLPLSGARPVNDDVRGEVEFHLQQRIADLEARGLSHAQASAEARASFGDRAAVEAECRAIEQRRRSTKQRADRLGALWQDLRLGARVLRKSPGFTLAAIFTLALGIGANAAVFSIVNGVILQPLAYDHAERLVTVNERNDKGGVAPVPWLNFVDLQAQSHSFDGLGAYGTAVTTVIVNGAALRVNAGAFSAGFFKAFPLKPVMGRLPSDDDRKLGASPVAVVSYAFWRDHLGAPARLDTVHIALDKATAVIGVLPDGFDFPNGNQIWLVMEREGQTASRTAHNWDVIGRLRAGVTPADADRELAGIYARLAPLYKPNFTGVGAELVPLQASMTGSLRTPLYLLLAASAVLLLGACVNLASAMLARGTARASEFAVRSALGATRTRLVRQLFTESALLALLGCAAGLALAAVLLKALGHFAPPSLHVERVHVDLWVQGFALTVTALTAVLFGLLPALRLSDGNGAVAIREGSRGGTAGARRMRSWNVLVGAEVALAVVLLSGSALLIRSFANVMETQLGFEASHAYTVQLELPVINYPDSSPTISAFHERVMERLGRLNGVQSVGFSNMLPLSGNYPNGGMIVEGKPLEADGRTSGYSIYRVVGGDFFAAMGLPVIKGRALRARGRKLRGTGRRRERRVGERGVARYRSHRPARAGGGNGPHRHGRTVVHDRRRGRERARTDGHGPVSPDVLRRLPHPAVVPVTAGELRRALCAARCGDRTVDSARDRGGRPRGAGGDQHDERPRHAVRGRPPVHDAGARRVRGGRAAPCDRRHLRGGRVCGGATHARDRRAARARRNSRTGTRPRAGLGDARRRAGSRGGRAARGRERAGAAHTALQSHAVRRRGARRRGGNTRPRGRDLKPPAGDAGDTSGPADCDAGGMISSGSPSRLRSHRTHCPEPEARSAYLRPAHRPRWPRHHRH